MILSEIQIICGNTIKGIVKTFTKQGGNCFLSEYFYVDPYSEHLLYSLINVSEDDLTIVWNKQKEIVLASNSVELYLDYKVANIVGRSWKSILPLHIVKLIENKINEKKKEIFIPVIKLKGKNGRTNMFNCNVVITNSPNGKYYICKMNNMNYIHQLKQSLIAKEKALLISQLSASLVHEIRNPLTSIKGFLQLIEAGVEYREEYFRVLTNEIDKVNYLLAELLDLSKPKRKSMQNYYVYNLVHETVLLMKVQKRMKNINFIIKIPHHLQVYCHATEIKQVFINLILNGAEAMDYNGTITIESEVDENNLYIRFIDKGSGISLSKINKIKEPYFTTKETGVGLGLVVTEQIIRNHAGELLIQSLPSKGSTFQIKLPLNYSYYL